MQTRLDASTWAGISILQVALVIGSALMGSPTYTVIGSVIAIAAVTKSLTTEDEKQ